MTDILTPEQRSKNMSRIRSKNTTPELLARSALHRAGYRFRIHRKDLPGNPDIVMPKRKLAIFIHGCYWHRHPGCKYAYTPKSRTDFWQKKFQLNIERDITVKDKLTALGWNYLVIWECETKDALQIQNIVRKFLCDRT